LVYTLIPIAQGRFEGSLGFERFMGNGQPAGPTGATAWQLASPRLRADTQGTPHHLELRLIRRLVERASAAGHVLPEIVASTTPRDWSRLRLSDATRDNLLRIGGAFDNIVLSFKGSK
jgi:hypothetical protein